MLTQSEILSLLSAKPITDEWPWLTGDELTIDKNIKGIVAEICRKLNLSDKSQYGHYGSGYASFVDCWLYRPADVRFASGKGFWGFVILFSRLSKYYVVGEGQKDWHGSGSCSYLPSFEFVDILTHDRATVLEDDVCNILQSHGLVRIRADEVAEFLPKGISVPTILSDPPWRQFDALFYWAD